MTTASIQPYLFFDGRCEEALEFYRGATGAVTGMLMRYRESPEPCQGLAPGWEDKVMHASFQVGGSMLMASDGCGDGDPFKGFALSLSLPTEEEAKRCFAALSDGGSVTMPPGRTFWSPLFGMLTDRFGLSWMVTVTPCEE